MAATLPHSEVMRIESTPPRDWDADLPSPVFSRSFATASVELGYRSLYVSASERAARALVLVRRVPVPLVSAWTGRALVYTSATDPVFLGRLLEHLAAEGISHVRIGDGLWSSERPFEVPWPRVYPEMRHLLVHAPAPTAAVALGTMEREARARIRKTERLGVVVAEVRQEADLVAYCTLAEETSARMRRGHIAAVYPPAFFRSVFTEMVPAGQALFLLARWQGRPLAGALYFVSPTRLGQCHGASTRDRALTRAEGPTAVAWHAMQLARTRGLEFDMGVTTPTTDTTHPHFSVFRFKQAFGGTPRQLHGAEVVLSRVKHGFQGAVLRPLWNRLHPVYLRLFAAPPERHVAT
jgi:hypothetical protein